MPRNLVLGALVALTTLLVGCDDTRTAAFCESACECGSSDQETQACTFECTRDIEQLEFSNSGAPLVSDECFACVDHNTCQNIFAICSSECADLIESLQNGPQPQPGDPIDTN